MGWIVVVLIVLFVLRGRCCTPRWTRSELVQPRDDRLAAPGRWHATSPTQEARGERTAARRAHTRGHVARHAAAPPHETEFEALKRRYVAGELTDEQYERALDALFRTPGGRQQV